MRTFLACCTALVVTSSWLACGGDSFSSGAGGGGGEGPTTGPGPTTSTTSTSSDSTSTNGTSTSTATAAGGGGASGGTGGSSGDGGATGGGGNAGGGTNAGGGGVGGSTVVTTGSGGGGGAPCPDPTGYYGTIVEDGAGCGDVSTDAKVCIFGTGEVCAYHLSSGGIGSSTGASANGLIDLQGDGSFDNAAILEGTVQRTGCDGTFDGTTLVIVCGGGDPTSSQYCKLTLTRTANVCPG